MLIKDVSKNNIYSQAADAWVSAILALVFFAIFIAANATGYDLFRKFHFTSDGFHYFSAIRNFSNHLSFWEGPTFEYILGNHSYLSMYLLVPLEWIFPTAFLMAFVNASSHFLTALLLVMCGYQVIYSPFRRTLSWLLGILYVAFPLVVTGYFSGVYMFQPDYLLAPLLALFFLFALTDKALPFFLTGALIILTKEEYIPLFPAFALLVLHCKWLMQGLWFPSTAQHSTARA